MKTLSSLALAAVLLLTSSLAGASAPMAQTSAPGFYRVMIGSTEVTALSDGTFAMPVDKLLAHLSPSDLRDALGRWFLKSPVPSSINAFLVNTGSKLVLVDSGSGGAMGPTTGKLLENLKASGYQPEQIDEIYITHMHGDHVGGLVVNGQRVFPNAIVRADKRDADFWLNPAQMEKAPAERKPTFQAAMNALNPYIQAGKFQPFDGETELLPGLRAVPRYGHTPGHTIYLVESQGQKLALWGDLMHVAAVQFEKPEVTIAFDSDSKSALAQRKTAFAEAAREGYLVAGAHLSFPAFGHIRAQGKGYAWVPLNYGSQR